MRFSRRSRGIRGSRHRRRGFKRRRSVRRGIGPIRIGRRM